MPIILPSKCKHFCRIVCRVSLSCLLQGMSRSPNKVLLRMLQRLVNVSQQQGKLHNDCFFLCSEASKQKAFHNKSLGDENRKKLKSWQTSMADVQVLEFVPSQWPLRQMKWAAASSRWTLSVKADCWAPMATPRDDVETALEYSFEDNASKKKLWRKKRPWKRKKIFKTYSRRAKTQETHVSEGFWPF